MMQCIYDKDVWCGNTIKSKRDCVGCETRADVLWERKQAAKDRLEKQG